MKLSALRRPHPDFDAESMERYGDLFEGATRVRKNIEKLIIRHDVEPPELYRRRCAAAHYLNYCGPIGGYFASWVFSRPPAAKAEPSAPPMYEGFKEDCDGKGTDLKDFLRDRFVEALVKQTSFWRLDFPAPAAPVNSLAEFEAQGLNKVRLVPVPTESVISWRKDKDGYIWLLEHCKEVERLEVEDEQDTVTETWTKWSRTEPPTRWQIQYPKNQPPNESDNIPMVPIAGVPGVPVVDFVLPPALFLMGHLAEPQLELFRKRCALSWAIDRACFVMAVLKMVDPKKPPAMGAGYYLQMGITESLEWPAPPTAPFDTISKYISDLKDEIHRVAQAMARGVDNNAAAVGRSGESKMADDRATEVVLRAYGSIMRGAVERTYQMISSRFEEKITWTIDGLEGYQIVDAAATIESAVVAETMRIPSPTYHRMLAEKVVAVQFPDMDEVQRKQISDELEKNLSNEEESLLNANRDQRPGDKEARQDEGDNNAPVAATG